MKRKQVIYRYQWTDRLGRTGIEEYKDSNFVYFYPNYTDFSQVVQEWNDANNGFTYERLSNKLT